MKAAGVEKKTENRPDEESTGNKGENAPAGDGFRKT